MISLNSPVTLIEYVIEDAFGSEKPNAQQYRNRAIATVAIAAIAAVGLAVAVAVGASMSFQTLFSITCGTFLAKAIKNIFKMVAANNEDVKVANQVREDEQSRIAKEKEVEFQKSMEALAATTAAAAEARAQEVRAAAAAEEAEARAAALALVSRVREGRDSPSIPSPAPESPANRVLRTVAVASNFAAAINGKN